MSVRTPRSVMNLGFQSLSQLWKWAELSAVALSALAHSTHPKNYVTFSSVKHIYIENLSYEVKCELQRFQNKTKYLTHKLIRGFYAQLTVELPQCCASASSRSRLLSSDKVLDLSCNMSSPIVSQAEDTLLEFGVQAKR